MDIDMQIKSNNISRFQLLFGDDDYLIKYYKNKLISVLSNPEDEMNVNRYNGDINPLEIFEVAQIFPFMAERRLIVIEKSGVFAKSSEISELIDKFPDTCYVIFVENKVDKRNKLYKYISRNGTITELNKEYNKDLKQWVSVYLKRANKMMSIKNIETFIARVGIDRNFLSAELEKLIGHSGDNREVTLEDIEAVSSGEINGKIFDMIDAVAFGERNRALSLYDDLLKCKEKPMSILYLMTRHINSLLMYKELRSLGASIGEMCKKIGVPEFVIKKYARQSEHFSNQKLYLMLEKRAEYEEKFKTGQIDDQLAVELFLIEALTKK